MIQLTFTVLRKDVVLLILFGASKIPQGKETGNRKHQTILK